MVMGLPCHERVTWGTEVAVGTGNEGIADGMGVTERNGSPPFGDLGPCRRCSLKRGRGGMVAETLPLKLVSGLGGVLGKGFGRQGAGLVGKAVKCLDFLSPLSLVFIRPASKTVHKERTANE